MIVKYMKYIGLISLLMLTLKVIANLQPFPKGVLHVRSIIALVLKLVFKGTPIAVLGHSIQIPFQAVDFAVSSSVLNCAPVSLDFLILGLDFTSLK